VLIAAFLLLCHGQTGLAQRVAPSAIPMADHVPADAVAYVGWSGADSQAAAYRASDLSAFIEHSNLPELARQYVPKLWDQITGQSRDPQTVVTMQKILPLLWRHPVAMYASHVSVRADGAPDVDLALVCEAGGDAAQLQSDLESLVKDWENVHFTSSGSVVEVGAQVSTGPVRPDGVAAATKDATLASVPAFIATMKKLQASPVIAVYVDAETILTRANESAASSNTEASDIWPKVRDALGIANLKSFAMTAGFDGSNWVTASSLEAPAPRTGLLAAFEPKPIDPALLARIPATAGSVSVYNFDAAKLFDTLSDAMTARKDSDTAFHQVAGAATVVLGRNLRRQILEPLGSQWVLYSDSKLHSAVLMNHPRDAEAADDAMVSAMFGLTGLANAQIPGAATQPVVNVDQKRFKGIALTSAVTKYVSPTEAMKDKILYLGLSADSVVAAANAAADGNLLHSEHFLAAQKKLGLTQFASFDYCDLPSTAPAACKNFGPAGEQMSQMLKMFNVEMPRVELPSVEQLPAHLSAALSVSWADADGVYSKSISPFPGSVQVLGDPQQMMVSATTVSTLAAAVVLPAIARARQAALANQGMSNERQLLVACIMYAQDHQGHFPPDLGALVSTGKIGVESLRSFLRPGSTIQIPKEIQTGTREQQAAWVNDNTDYKLLTPNLVWTEKQGRPHSEIPVLVPRDADTATDRVSIGFADGHCEACKPGRARHFLHPDE
jgi:hypothetical protein